MPQQSGSELSEKIMGRLELSILFLSARSEEENDDWKAWVTARMII